MRPFYAVVGQGWIEDEAENSVGCAYAGTDLEKAIAKAREFAEENAEGCRQNEEDLDEDEKHTYTVREIGDSRGYDRPDRVLVVFEEETSTWWATFEVVDVAHAEIGL